MKLFHTKPDDVLDPSDVKCPGYRNKNTAWWDLSQIYGSSEAITQGLRTTNGDGKLSLTKDGKEEFLPRDATGNVITGFSDNWWIGLELLTTMFAREHNSICDMLKTHYPEMSGLVLRQNRYPTQLTAEAVTRFLTEPGSLIVLFRRRSIPSSGPLQYSALLPFKSP